MNPDAVSSCSSMLDGGLIFLPGSVSQTCDEKLFRPTCQTAVMDNFHPTPKFFESKQRGAPMTNGPTVESFLLWDDGSLVSRKLRAKA